MNLQEISNFISSVGFPIVVCVYLAWSNEKQNSVIANVSETLKGIDIRLQHNENSQKEFVNSFTDKLNNISMKLNLIEKR